MMIPGKREELEKILPKCLPKWEVVSELGRGTFGSVFKIKKQSEYLEKEFRAIKIMVCTQEEVAIFKKDDNEINLMKSVDNENIVKVYDYYVIKDERVQNQFFALIVMEFMESNLQRDMENRFLTENEIRYIGIAMCNALISCRSIVINGRIYELLHRDIKPGNILRSGNKYKLSDFGVSRIIKGNEKLQTYAGTPAYMAPEIRLGKYYDRRADIYSLGLILYQLVNGNYLPDQIKRPNNRQYVSEKLIDIIMKAVSFNPEDRYSSAEEMKEALLHYNDKHMITKEFTPKTISSKNPKNLDSIVRVGVLIVAGILILTIGSSLGNIKNPTSVNEQNKRQEYTEDNITEEKEEVHKIKSNQISGSLTYEGQVDVYEYTPSIDGEYRFDFDISNVNSSYYFSILSSSNEVIEEGSSFEEGKNIELNQEETYRIEISQEEDFVDYEINIGVPKEIKEITGDVITGDLKYEEQKDRYIYKPNTTGDYRFDFEIDDINNEYEFKILESNNEYVLNSSSAAEGKTVELFKGKIYTIIVKQSYGMSKYKINIGVPKEIMSVSGKKISGSLTYEDQKDIYKYKAPISGEYVFNFEISDSNTDYQIKLLEKNNEEIFSRNAVEEEKSVELEGGKEYKIEIINYDTPVSYVVTINY